MEENKKTSVFLLPGELVCNWLNVQDKESRMLLRMFVNLSVYGKIGVVLLLGIRGLGA